MFVKWKINSAFVQTRKYFVRDVTNCLEKKFMSRGKKRAGMAKPKKSDRLINRADKTYPFRLGVSFFA